MAGSGSCVYLCPICPSVSTKTLHEKILGRIFWKLLFPMMKDATDRS